MFSICSSWVTSAGQILISVVSFTFVFVSVCVFDKGLLEPEPKNRISESGGSMSPPVPSGCYAYVINNLSCALNSQHGRIPSASWVQLLVSFPKQPCFTVKTQYVLETESKQHNCCTPSWAQQGKFVLLTNSLTTAATIQADISSYIITNSEFKYLF